MSSLKRINAVIDGDIAYKIVSNGKYKVIVDVEFSHLLINNTISVRTIRGNANGANVSNRINGKTVNVPIHRIIMGLENGDKREVDHIDRDPLNNRRNNLRIVSRAENLMNRSGKSRGSSKYKGVGKVGKSFYVTIRKDKVDYNLGYFKNEIEAAKAYDAKAVELYGEFAFTNFTGDICNIPDHFEVIETKRGKEPECKPLINSWRNHTKEEVDMAKDMFFNLKNRRSFICRKLNMSYGVLTGILNGKTYKNF